MRAHRLAPWLFCASAALAGGLAASPARAQAAHPGASAAPGAGTAAPDKVEAREKYKRAKADFEAKHFEQALKGFRESYAVLPSPNSHLMIANTLAELGRSAEAYAEARRVRAEATAAVQADPKYQETVTGAEQTISRLRPKIGLLTIQADSMDSGAALVVAGHPVERAEWSEPVPVEPGAVTVSLSGTGGEKRRDLQVAAGSEQTVDFKPVATGPVGASTTEPQAEPASSGGFNPFDRSKDQRIMAYVVGGVGVASLITFGILGGMHLSKYNDLKDKCTDGHCPADLQSEADKGRGLQTGANVTLGLGLAFLAGGAALFFTTDFMGNGDKAGAEPGSDAAPATPPPEVSIGPGSISVYGRF